MLTTRKHAIAFTAIWTALTAAALWALLAGLAHRLPDPIAVHWSGTAPDRGESVNVFALQFAGFHLVGAVVAAIAAWHSDLERRTTRRTLGAGIGLWSGVVIGAVAATAAVNLDRAHWSDARLSGGGLALLLALTIALPALTAFIGAAAAGNRPDAPRPEAQGTPALDLPEGTRLAWSHRQGAGSTFLIMSIAAAALALTGLLVGDGEATLAIAVSLAVVLLAGLLFGGFTVTAGSRGVQVRLGLLGWINWRIPLADIASAHVDERGPADVGGWGLRIVPGRCTAVMTRKGECLVLRRNGKREAIISADDAATGAAVLNTLARTAQ
ncbi:MAG TPA: hypothetical protein VFU12_03285 [Glycomyces sp.]|nr:hypothetical protein [Glycomyces sp.]